MFSIELLYQHVFKMEQWNTCSRNILGFFCSLFLSSETGSLGSPGYSDYLDKAGLKVRFFCFCLLSTGIKGVYCHHLIGILFYFVFKCLFS